MSDSDERSDMEEKPDHILRIACYGFAEPQAGSVSSAGFVVLRGLLERGHHIDFFNKSNFVRPRELEAYANYHFFDVPNPGAERWGERIGRFGGTAGRFVGGTLVHRTFANGILRAMRRENARRSYDVQFWFGEWAWGRLENVPVVSWTQGPPETDARSIARNRGRILSLCGPRVYWPLRAYAAYRATTGLPVFRRSDVIVVGSQWARKRLCEYDIGQIQVDVLPYPTDLSTFSPDDQTQSIDAQTVLWVGRVVPRKRLDLFLDACAILIRDGVNLRVRIIGGFGFVPGYRKLLDRFPFPDRLSYTESLPREQVIPELRAAAVLVQPSEDENFGSAVAEALACGTPVVVGPTNGTGDYLGNGGLVFTRYTPQDVAASIAAALSEGTGFRHRARAAAEANFSVKKIVTSLISVLENAIEKNQANSRITNGSALTKDSVS